MKNTLMISTLVALYLVSATTAAEPYSYDFEPRLVTKTNNEIEKMMPILEKQVEFLIKMVGNAQYRAKLESEFALVITGYDNVRTTAKECIASKNGCQAISLKDNENAWDSGQKLSFLASVLKQYKAPLSKTCIGIVHKDENPAGQRGATAHQPLSWKFPLQFLSGSMFGNKFSQQMGFGMVDLRSLDESELIRMAKLSNQIVELQTILQDGIEGEFDEDALQKITSYKNSGDRYIYLENSFGIWDNRTRKPEPCDLFAGKGAIARAYWPVIGYEIILPAEIVTSNKYWTGWTKKADNMYSFGGDRLKYDFAKLPSEYINAWKNLAIYYQKYFPGFPGLNGSEIDMYDELLAKKLEAPLGDLMSEDSGSAVIISTSEDDDLALPSLD
jgi:hypothetical protein